MVLDFEWDAKKAQQNVVKHGVSFVLASSVFRDPLALTIFDDEHSADEERWVTIGYATNEKILLVVHTFLARGVAKARVRIISARRADRDEISDYEQSVR